MTEAHDKTMAVASFSDEELTQLIAEAKDELAARVRRRKEETIAKIRELASSVGVSVSIGGARGRPGRGKSAKPVKAEMLK